MGATRQGPQLLASRGVWQRLGAGRWNLALLVLVVGVGAGLGAIAFRYMIEAFTWVFTGHLNLAAEPHPVSPWLPGLGIGCVVLAPVLAGLVYGPLVARFAPEARGHGVPEVMLAVARAGGRIRPPVPLVKSLASALCIGAGGSVGREGPIVQIGSALGSTLGQIARLPERRIRLLVACGAAGGIAATFNAPIAGVFFALEVILRDFQAESFGYVVLSSRDSRRDRTNRLRVGGIPDTAGVPAALRRRVPALCRLGVLAAFAGFGFIRTLYGGEDLADRLWRGPEWLRPAVGGVVLGLVLLALPQMYGVGYPVLESAVRGHYLVAFLALLLIGKVVATSLTLAIGGSGGVFAPSLFMGATLGAGYGQVLHDAVPQWATTPGAYALVGMGAVFAATARAPITAVIIIFELTGDYGIILPLMVAVVVATGISALLSADTIYTLKLRRRGIDVERSRPSGPMQLVRVEEAMRPTPERLPSGLDLDGLVERLIGGPEDALPVVDDDGRLRGVISAEDVEAALAGDIGERSAGDLARQTPVLRAHDPLEQAAHLLVESDEAGLPVIAPHGPEVVGWITHRDVLLAYSTRRSKEPTITAHPHPESLPREPLGT